MQLERDKFELEEIAYALREAKEEGENKFSQSINFVRMIWNEVKIKKGHWTRVTLANKSEGAKLNCFTLLLLCFECYVYIVNCLRNKIKIKSKYKIDIYNLEVSKKGAGTRLNMSICSFL